VEENDSTVSETLIGASLVLGALGLVAYGTVKYLQAAS